MRTGGVLTVAAYLGLAFAQNVGIGTATPNRARLEVAGMVGNTNAILGAGGQGIGIINNWPGIGFNMYWSGGPLSISNGYTGSLWVSPLDGHFEMRLGQTNATGPNVPVTENVVMTVLRNGNVGIGTTTPTQRLDVVGNVQFSGALMPAGNPGTPGQILTSQGAGNAPVWTSLWGLVYVDAWNSSSTTSNGWTCTGCAGGPPYLTTCGSTRMLGGYNVCGNGCYFEKTYTSLPPHSEIMVEVFWWSIDSWDQNSNPIPDQISISIDGIVVARATPYDPVGRYNGNFTDNRYTDRSVCGWTEMIDIGPQVAVGWASHSASNATIRVTNNADQGPTDESMGIVMVRVWVK